MSETIAEKEVKMTVPSVQIANDVIGVIAGIAATEVTGVAGMSGGLVGGISEILGKKSLNKGVRVDVKEALVYLDLHIIVQYGAKIPEIAARVQESAKRQVENMTGLSVAEVNIHVQGVSFAARGENADAEDSEEN